MTTGNSTTSQVDRADTGVLTTVARNAVVWHPVETAPRDGSRILAWPCWIRRHQQDGEVHSVSWESRAECWSLDPLQSGSYCGDWFQDPTHWAELPEGPQ